MNKFAYSLLAIALLATGIAWAEDDDTEEFLELDDADTGTIADEFGLEDMAEIGNPLKRWASNWPEDLVVAPVPGFSPQMGWQLTLGVGYFLETRDPESDAPASILGGFVMGAENGSNAYGLGTKLHLLDDDLRIKFGVARADIRYRFYGIGNGDGRLPDGIRIRQAGPLYFGTASWRVWKRLYVGLGYMGGSIETRLRFGDPASLSFDPNLTLDIGAITVPIEIDSRDDQLFPREGWLIGAKGVFYRESVGSDFDAETFKFSANHYLPVGERDVLASRVVIKSSSDGTPFFLVSSFGGSVDLRGYPSGRYRDNKVYAVQSEYRWHFRDRWILTGFAGFGEVAESLSDFGENFLPAAGVGVRFVLSAKHKVSLSADIATGKDGTEFYFGVGEAF